jgi:uncharacterized protein YjbJ (UPF0337 family)
VVDVERGKDNFIQIKTRIKQQWRRLPEEEISELESRKSRSVEILAAKLQEHYGWNREEAERQVREFQARHNWH